MSSLFVFDPRGHAFSRRDRQEPSARGSGSAEHRSDLTVHRPVLVDEVIEALAPAEGAVLVDGTVGAGGHAALLARRVGPAGRIIALDRDPA
ncbi:MAG: 16S rRNA (cytosine(1402)-N(4))-methyltransferase, partial [Isosphaeraceae bacterium]